MTSILSNQNNFLSFQFVNHVSETQLQVSEKSKSSNFADKRLIFQMVFMSFKTEIGLAILSFKW